MLMDPALHQTQTSVVQLFQVKRAAFFRITAPCPPQPTQRCLLPSRPHRAAEPVESTCPCPHAPERTWAAGVGLCVGASLFFSVFPFHLGSKLKASRGSRSGVEKVLEAAFFQKGLHFWGVCVWPECLGCCWRYLLEGGKGRGKSLCVRAPTGRGTRGC